MGGLIARDMIANHYLTTIAGYSSGKVVGLITLGTPHLGYPYIPDDDFFSCPQLDQDMAGGWLPLFPTPVELPPLPTNGSTPTFFDKLRQAWVGTSLPYWLAAAGTAYTNSIRTVPFNNGVLAGGCITPGTGISRPTPPYSDGVVCRDSALYQEPAGFSGWAPAPGPTEPLWQDPDQNYVHTLQTFFGYSTLLFGAITKQPLYELYQPPFPGKLVSTIVSSLNAH